jgi:hypothetical protein
MAAIGVVIEQHQRIGTKRSQKNERPPEPTRTHLMNRGLGALVSGWQPAKRDEGSPPRNALHPISSSLCSGSLFCVSATRQLELFRHVSREHKYSGDRLRFTKKTVLASSPQIETTLHIINFIAVGFKQGAIAKLSWPSIGVARMNNVPANASVANTALQVWNVCRLL